MKKYYIVMIFMLLVSLISTAFSGWLIGLSYDNRTIVDETSAVAYVKEYDSDNTTLKSTIYFTSLDGAINYSYKSNLKDEIFVIPSNNPVTEDNVVVLDGRFAESNIYKINSNDSLILPYEGEKITETISSSPYLAYESGSCMNYVKINSGIKIENYGTITVGAIQNSGNGGNNYNGNATKKYSKIFLEGNSEILNKEKSTFNCYGYVDGCLNNDGKPTGKFICETKSNINVLFTIVEHRGGAIYLGMAYKNKSDLTSNLIDAVLRHKEITADLTCFVFNRFFVDSILNTNFNISSGAIISGLGCLYADGSPHSATVKLIGITDEYIINLNRETKLSGWFDKVNKKMNLVTEGGFNFNDIAMKLELQKAGATVKINMSSKDVLFPISHYFSIENKKGTGKNNIINATTQGFKLLPGSSLIVEDGVTLNAKDIAVYPNSFFYPDGTTSIEYGEIGNSKYPIKDDGVLVVNGNLLANQVGGFIQINTNVTDSASLVIKNNSISSSELCATEDAVIDLVIKKMNYKSSIYETKTLTATGYVKQTGGNNMLSELENNIYYVGEETYWIREQLPTIQISPSSRTSGTREAMTVNIAASVSSFSNDRYDINWETSGDLDIIDSFVVSNDKISAILKTKAASFWNSKTVYVKVSIVRKSDGQTMCETVGTYKAKG